MKQISRKLAYGFIFLAIIFMTIFNLVGSSVDKNGLLTEPFFLIPLSYISFTIGIVFVIISVVKKK